MTQATADYGYAHAAHSHAHAYILPTICRLVRSIGPRRVIDLGCGNGSVASHLSAQYEVASVDASESGIAQAKSASQS